MELFLKLKKNKHLISFLLIFLSLLTSIDFTISTLVDYSNYEKLEKNPVNIYIKGTNPNNWYSTVYSKINNSQLTIEKTFNASVIKIDEISINFTNKLLNTYKSEFFDFETLLFLGVNQDYYTELRQSKYSNIISVENSWKDFENQISPLFLSGIDQYEFLTEMVLSFEKNEENTLIHISDLNTSTYANNISSLFSINKNNTLINLSFHEILQLFGYKFEIVNSLKKYGIFLADESIFQEILNIEQYLDLKSEDSRIFLINQENLLEYDFQTIYSSCESLINNLRWSLPGKSIIIPLLEVKIINSWEITSYSLIFYIPLILIFILIMNNQLNESMMEIENLFNILKRNGFSYKIFCNSIIINFFIMGLLTGTIGTYLGKYLALFLIKKIFFASSFLMQGQISPITVSVLKTNIQIYALLTSLLLSILIYSKLGKSSKENNSNLSKKKKKERSWFLIFIISIIYFFSLYITFINPPEITYLYQSFSYKISFISNWGLLLLPIFTIIPIVFCITIAAYLISLTAKIWKNKSQSFPKKLFKQKYLKWNIGEEINKKKNILVDFIIYMTLIYLFLTLTNSYSYSCNLKESIVRGNSEVAYISLSEKQSYFTISSSNLTNQKNWELLNFTSENAIFYSDFNDEINDLTINDCAIRFQSLPTNGPDFKGFRFATTNYSHLLYNTQLSKDWFFGKDPKELFQQLNSDPNAIIIPNYFLELNFSIGDDMAIIYRSVSGELIKKTGKIIGAYNYFPTSLFFRMTFNDFKYENIIYFNSNLIEEMLVCDINLLLYDENDQWNALQNNESIKHIIDNVLNVSYHLHISTNDFIYDTFSYSKIINLFLRLESFYLIVVLIIMFLSKLFYFHSKPIKDENLLYIWGIPKRKLFEYRFYSNLICILIILTTFSLSLIIPLLYIIELNIISSILPIYYKIPIKNMLLMFLIGSIIFIVSDDIFSRIRLRKKILHQTLETSIRY